MSGLLISGKSGDSGWSFNRHLGVPESDIRPQMNGTSHSHFYFDGQTMAAVERIRSVFKLSSPSDAVRRSLAIALVACDNLGADCSLTIVGRNGENLKIEMD